MVFIKHYFISWRCLVRCPANAITRHIAQLLCYCEKDHLCSQLDSGRLIFHWSKLRMLSPWVQLWVQGRSAGSFPEQQLVIEPITWLAFKNKSREPTLLEKDQHLCMRDEPIRHALVPSFCSLRMDAWEHDLPFGKKNGCIFWLGLSYESPSNKEFLPYGSGVTSCKWAMMTAKMRLLHVVCRVLLFSIFEASVHASWASQTTKLVGESHSDSYLCFCVCSTNNTKDYKYVW